jgi:hypothetical protein
MREPMRDELTPRDQRDHEETDALEFEEAFVLTGRRRRWYTRLTSRVIPIALMIALLLAVADPAEVAVLLHRAPADIPVRVTVVCDVPWATVRVDGRGAATPCEQGSADTLPVARLEIPSGAHTLVATAAGFAPYPIYIVVHPNIPGLYLTQFVLTPEGAAAIVSAVNDYFASHFVQETTLPGALWGMFGLSGPPMTSSLVLREQFEAVALDSYEPFYTQTTYQRPITPASGMVGVAVVVVEHVTISGDCGATPLFDQRLPVLYTSRASATFSARPGTTQWSVSQPYALNPIAGIFTAPNLAAKPATPDALLALAARTRLAEQLGNLSAIPDAITLTPLVDANHWSSGVLLALPDTANKAAEARWLYSGGRLIALNAAARALLPGLAQAPVSDLSSLRAGLANTPQRACAL